MHVMQVLLCLIPFFSVNVSALFKFVLQPPSVLGLRVLSLCQNGKWHKLLISSERRARPHFMCWSANLRGRTRGRRRGTTEHKTSLLSPSLVCSAITSHPSNLMAAPPTAALLTDNTYFAPSLSPKSRPFVLRRQHPVCCVNRASWGLQCYGMDSTKFRTFIEVN